MVRIEKEIESEKGFIRFNIEDKTAKIDILAIYPKYRGSGIGRLMMEEALDIIRENNVNKVTLTAASFYNDEFEKNALPQEKLIRFYESFGFRSLPTEENFVVPMELIF